MKAEDWSIDVETNGLTKEVILSIGESLWIDRLTLDDAWEKHKQYFGEFGDFLIVVSRLVYLRKEIIDTLTKTKNK